MRLVEDRIAVGIEQDEIGCAEAAAGQHDRLGVGDRRIGDLGIADDHLADWPVELQYARVIHVDAQHVILGAQRSPEARKAARIAG